MFSKLNIEEFFLKICSMSRSTRTPYPFFDWRNRDGEVIFAEKIFSQKIVKTFRSITISELNPALMWLSHQLTSLMKKAILWFEYFPKENLQLGKIFRILF